MICRSCGTEIAEKALICYRCGTATTEAKYKAPAAAGRRRGTLVVIMAIVLALLVLLAFFLLNSRAMNTDARRDGVLMSGARVESSGLRVKLPKQLDRQIGSGVYGTFQVTL